MENGNPDQDRNDHRLHAIAENKLIPRRSPLRERGKQADSSKCGDIVSQLWLLPTAGANPDYGVKVSPPYRKYGCLGGRGLDKVYYPTRSDCTKKAIPHGFERNHKSLLINGLRGTGGIVETPRNLHAKNYTPLWTDFLFSSHRVNRG